MIQPSNITFTAEAVLKLIDFDEAVCFDEKSTSPAQFTFFEDFGKDELMQGFRGRKRPCS
jgi:hypothetical protein